VIYDEPALDPMGPFLTEVRSDVDMVSLVSGRVRGFEPAPDKRNAAGQITEAGDVQPRGKYKAFVVVVALDVPPHPRLPVTFATYGVRCYGATPQNAWAVWGAFVKATHRLNPRLKSSGIGFYQSLVLSGGEQEKDPDTGQPVVTGAVRLIATTQAVAS
jgi:hypothetical protein